jgi:ribonuclease HI
MTMTLNWSFHQRRVLADCRAQSTAVSSSSLTPAAKLLTMQRWIQRKIAYAFPVVPYSDTDLDTLDRACARVIRTAYGLHRGMPLALIRSPVAEFGLGHTSLSVLYHTENIKHLAWALNHSGPVAGQTLAVLRWQLGLVSHTREPTWSDLSHLSRARQAYLVMATDRLSLSVDGTRLTPPTGSILRSILPPNSPHLAISAHTLRPILDLYPDGQGLFVRGAMIHENDVIRQHNTSVSSAHIRSHRALSHLLCQGGTPPAPKRPWNLSAPLPRSGLPLRPAVVAALGRLSRSQAPGATTHGPQTIPAALARTHAPPSAPRAPLIPVATAPCGRYTAPLVPTEHIRTLLLSARPPSREHAFRALRDTPPPHLPQDEWRLALLDFMTGHQERVRSLGEPITVRTGTTTERHFQVTWADTVLDDWAYRENLHHGYVAEWARPVHLLPRTACYWCGASGPTGNLACPDGCPPAPASPPTRAVWVRWLPRLEPEHNLRDEGYGGIIDHWLRHDLARRHHRLYPPQARPPPYTYSLPAHGTVPPGVPDLLGGFVTIDTCPCDPGLDASPPDGPMPSAFLTHQHVHSLVRHPDAPPTISASRLYVVHDAAGRAAGTLTRRTLATLYAGWRTAHSSPSTGGNSFTTELMALVRRRRAALRLPTDEDPSPNWSLTAPPPLMRHVLRAFHILREPFATPIDRHPEIPHYWSPDPRDSAFGANHDAYSSPFRSGSFCHPNHRAADVFRALEWAIASARTTSDPVLTVLLAPSTPSAGFWGLAERNTDTCRILGTCRAARSQYLPPEAFTLNPALRTEHKYSTVLLVIANQSGWDTISRPLHLAALHSWLQPPPPASPARARYTAGWRPVASPADLPSPPQWLPAPLSAAPTRVDTGTHSLPTVLDRPLRYMDHELAYTDGSVRRVAGTTISGMSCWQPQPGAAPSPTEGATSLLLAPAADAPNSNHAELSALLWAVTHTDSTVFATDSLSSLHQMAGFLARPDRYRNHYLRGHLEAMAAALRARQAAGRSHVRFVKVTAHSGVLGNEIADWHASRSTHDLAAATVWNPPATVHLAELWDTPPSGTPTRLRDTGTALTRLVRSSHALGAANTDGVYYQAYRDIATCSHPSSHHFLSHGATPWGTRRLSLRYRGGGIYNNKLAHRYGLSATDTCPLCPRQDGQTHMLLECEHHDMHNMHCKRHNQAARAVLESVAKHDLGATIVQSHIGVSDELTSALAGVPNHIPGIPADLPRPDFTLHLPGHDGAPPRVLIIEVKYGADTLLEGKYDTVANHLRPTVRAASRYYRCEAKLLFIALGVGGRIPTLVYQHLLELGIPRRAAHNLCNHLNMLATQWLHKIVAGRRALAPVTIVRRAGRPLARPAP